MQYSISHDFGQRNRVSQINSIFLPTLRLTLGLGKGEELCQKADSRCCVILASQLQFSSADCSSFTFKNTAQTKTDFFHNSRKIPYCEQTRNATHSKTCIWWWPEVAFAQSMLIYFYTSVKVAFSTHLLKNVGQPLINCCRIISVGFRFEESGIKILRPPSSP